MRKRIDLNVDLAEGFPWDDDLIGLCSTANICLGAHAGSAALARETAARCAARGVRVCLHPGYADRESMGRASRAIEGEAEAGALLRSLLDQAAVLPDAAAIKPHGALYHDSATHEAQSAVLAALLVRLRVPLIGFSIGRHRAVAGAAGVPFLSEGFADRALDAEGALVPRSRPGALLTDPAEAAAQALALAPRVDTLCIHGDSPGCVDIVRAVRSALREDGWEIGA